MIALVDCVSFYANVERQFHAALETRPILVLSNNDGNIVSLSPEARALGFKRGMAYHQCRDLIRAHRVAVFSSNFALYYVKWNYLHPSYLSKQKEEPHDRCPLGTLSIG